LATGDDLEEGFFDGLWADVKFGAEQTAYGLMGAFHGFTGDMQDLARDALEAVLPATGILDSREEFRAQMRRDGAEQIYDLYHTVGEQIGLVALVAGGCQAVAKSGPAIAEGWTAAKRLVGLGDDAAKTLTSTSTTLDAGPSLTKVYRYCGDDEAKLVAAGKPVPSTTKTGQPKEIALTTERYTTAAAAEQNLNVGALDPRGPQPTPTHRIEVDVSGARLSYAGNSGTNGALEIRTADPVPGIKVEPLTPSDIPAKSNGGSN
jgi:hypothetical protein